MADVPDSVLDMVEFEPMEDVLLPVLHAKIPQIPAVSLIPDEDQPFPLILARSSHSTSLWHGDERFVDIGMVAIHTFTDGQNADEQGARLSEAIRVALRNAAREQFPLPGGGRLHAVTMTSRPRRVTDWATSTGPVQYADLPSGTFRYETLYRVTVKRSRS